MPGRFRSALQFGAHTGVRMIRTPSRSRNSTTARLDLASRSQMHAIGDRRLVSKAVCCVACSQHRILRTSECGAHRAKVLVKLYLHATSRPYDDPLRVISAAYAMERERRQLEAWKCRDLLDCHAVGHEIDDERYPDAMATNTRLAMADRRVGHNAFEKLPCVICHVPELRVWTSPLCSIGLRGLGSHTPNGRWAGCVRSARRRGLSQNCPKTLTVDPIGVRF